MTQRLDNSFSKQLRKATRDIHKISDHLVNAKLAFALSSDDVWAEGLICFYEIFKFLEKHVPLNQLPKEYHRTKAFEADLEYYLGTNWKISYQPRKEVQKYIEHLETLSHKNSILLLAYVYHLYMGLLSGGQILQKKRSIAKRIPFMGAKNQSKLHEKTNNEPGMNVTSFNSPIGELKIQMRKLIDDMAENFDDSTKQALIEESYKVFELNNEVVRSIKGTNFISYYVIFILIFMVVFFMLFLYKIYY